MSLNIPTPSQDHLKAIPAIATDMERWLSKLPMANTGQSSKELYQAIRALNDWRAPTAFHRFEMLEAIRPYIHSVCHVLSSHFLQSSITLNDKQFKIANLNQALQGHLATGYKMVVSEALNEPRKKELRPSDRASRLIVKAVHRAITDSSHVLLRAFQLYSQPARGTWLDINQLYRIAEELSLCDVKVEDKQTRYITGSSIQDAFVRIHLLGSAKPGNLRQQDLQHLFEATEYWASLCDVIDANDGDSIFLVNLNSDRTCQYRKNIGESIDSSSRSLRTRELADALDMHLNKPDKAKDITVPKDLSDILINHASQSWGVHWQRSFRRMPSKGELSVCVGFSALHYFCANQIEFEQYMLSIKPNTLGGDGLIGKNVDTGQKISDDVWADAFDAGGSRIPENNNTSLDVINFINKHKSTLEKPQSDKRYHSHNVEIVNASPSGYCIQWQGELPAIIQAGELIGVMEKGINQWSVAVIRWIRHLREKGTQMGIELLAPKAEVVAVRLLQKTGTNGPMMRGFILPEVAAISQSETLLLPRIPFRNGSKIELNSDQKNGRYLLQNRLVSTSSFSQFDFFAQELRSKHSTIKTPSEENNDEFDSLWGKF
ncbi:MAG: hypothetical protein P1U57_03395 [Oleibacter sp.]|nr:hypothetical protein [Thalassolituus sp.]